MNNKKAMRLAVLIVIALFPTFAPQSSFAQQAGRPPDCPPLTEQESKRRYPPVDVQPGKVYVFGSVRRAGAFDHEDGLTLLRAIELAGGAQPDASMRVRIMRVRVGEPEQPAVEIDLEKVAKKQAPDVALDSGAVIDVESKCASSVAPVQQPYYDTVPKRKHPPAG